VKGAGRSNRRDSIGKEEPGSAEGLRLRHVSELFRTCAIREMFVQHHQAGHDCFSTQIKRSSTVGDPHIRSIAKRRDFSACDDDGLVVLRRCTRAVDEPRVREGDDFDR
jgi:hypothetical protein